MRNAVREREKLNKYFEERNESKLISSSNNNKNDKIKINNFINNNVFLNNTSSSI